MAREFMYVVAIIDLYSRYAVNWSLSNTRDADWITGNSNGSYPGGRQTANYQQFPESTPAFIFIKCDIYSINFEIKP